MFTRKDILIWALLATSLFFPRLAHTQEQSLPQKFIGSDGAVEMIVDSMYSRYLNEGERVFSWSLHHACNDIPFDSLKPEDTLFSPLSRLDLKRTALTYEGSSSTVFRNSYIHLYAFDGSQGMSEFFERFWILEYKGQFEYIDLELDSLGLFDESLALLNKRLALEGERRYTPDEIIQVLDEMFEIRGAHEFLTQWLDLFVDGGKPHEDPKRNMSRKRWAHDQLDVVRNCFPIPVLREIHEPWVFRDEWPYRVELYVWTNRCHVYRLRGVFDDRSFTVTELTDFGRCYCSMR